jgi:hypothetical protein
MREIVIPCGKDYIFQKRKNSFFIFFFQIFCFLFFFLKKENKKTKPQMGGRPTTVEARARGGCTTPGMPRGYPDSHRPRWASGMAAATPGAHLGVVAATSGTR